MVNEAGELVCDDECYYPVHVSVANQRMIALAPDLARIALAAQQMAEALEGAAQIIAGAPMMDGDYAKKNAAIYDAIDAYKDATNAP